MLRRWKHNGGMATAEERPAESLKQLESQDWLI